MSRCERRGARACSDASRVEAKRWVGTEIPSPMVFTTKDHPRTDVGLKGKPRDEGRASRAFIGHKRHKRMGKSTLGAGAR